MKWTYIIRQKLKAATALGIVFVLVFVTNWMDKNSFSKLQNSFSAVYEDRLMAEIYIYKLSALLHKKKSMVEEPNALTTNIYSVIQVHNDSIKNLISKYEATKLTPAESTLFAELKKNLHELAVLEADYSDAAKKTELGEAIEKQHKKLTANLDGLSEIQFLEGRSLINNSKQIIAASNLTSQFEIGILIVIGLIVQALIFTSKSMRPNFYQDRSMN